MKQLLFIIAITLSLCSCSVVKKHTSKTQSTTDSVATKSSVQFETKSKDSIGIGVVKTSETKTSNNTYTKTMTTREYYTDEFDFDATIDPANDSANSTKADDYFPYKDQKINQGKPKVPGKMLYRETTVKEEGKLITNEGKEGLTKQKSDVKESENVAKKSDETTQVKKEEKQVSKNKNASRLLPGLGAVLFFIILFYIAYRYHKQQVSKFKI